VDRVLIAILLAGLALRLVDIGAPLIDQQAWRQTDTAAIARNYLAEGLDRPFYPRVDWRGDTLGYVEMNFPLFPYSVALLYAAAGGVHEWLGRLLAALLSTASAGILYLLCRRTFGDVGVARVAAALYLMVPVSWFFGRAFMPEALMMLLSLASLYTFDRWLRSGRWADFAVAVTCAAACFLVKIPTLYLGFPLVAMAWRARGLAFLRDPRMWLYLIAVLAPAAAWYAHAANLFHETGLTFGIWNRYGYDKWDSSLLLTGEFYAAMASRFAHNILTPGVALLTVAGTVLTVRHVRDDGGRSLYLLIWVAGLGLYLVLVPEGNHKLHYYQLPFVPVCAILAAQGLMTWTRRCGAPWGPRLVVVTCAATMAYSAWVAQGYYRPDNNVYHYHRSAREAGSLFNSRADADAVVVTGELDQNAGAPHRSQNPTLLYYANRKGWQITPDEFQEETLSALQQRGADLFFAAVGFVRPHSEFWDACLRRGVSTAAMTAWAHTDADYLALTRRDRDPARHFVVVRLAPD
jgi:4-amino-4-deoxy-L-arabinose transferase-like glycosyltransferase